MALITTNASLTRQYNAFTGLSALQRSQSGIARAELVYYAVNQSWASPGAGNTRLFQIPTTSLPKDFGYVLTDVRFNIHAAANLNYVNAEMTGDFRIFPGGSLGPMIPCSFTAEAGRQDATASTPIGDIAASNYNTLYPSIYGVKGSANYVMHDMPTGIIYPYQSNQYTTTPNPASTFDAGIGEQLANGPAYEVSVYIRFLQYDIDQSYNYVIQSPQLTR